MKWFTYATLGYKLLKALEAESNSKTFSDFVGKVEKAINTAGDTLDLLAVLKEK